ncbi:amino acid synthesis family protein [Roseovarius rhodophyticola]|uniref:Amino acid synthesis family protein n=1 Tax=Roseovarius rhodophyticola TaxID=3080827 RepID=A0ABZ2TB05_9RHOB|nr:amino acid synthesis family protein [Roseovarius sp. W115]MDV2930519.1 amino acid synthesis family protein [Roseovarius sp. W115]
MTPEIRKYVTFIEDTLIEGHKPANPPLRMAAIAAVLKNPWSGRFVEDLRPEIHAFAPILGQEMVTRLMPLVGGGDRVQAFGKSAIVGVNGEIEHGSALIHTLRFGNFLRDAVQSSEFIPFSNKRGGPGNSITMPLKHITQGGTRSHFLTVEFNIPDAPGPDEVLIAIGVATGGRPHHRIGDRYQDMEELGHDQTVRPDKG